MFLGLMLFGMMLFLVVLALSWVWVVAYGQLLFPPTHRVVCMVLCGTDVNIPPQALLQQDFVRTVLGNPRAALFFLSQAFDINLPASALVGAANAASASAAGSEWHNFSDLPEKGWIPALKTQLSAAEQLSAEQLQLSAEQLQLFLQHFAVAALKIPSGRASKAAEQVTSSSSRTLLQYEEPESLQPYNNLVNSTVQKQQQPRAADTMMWLSNGPGIQWPPSPPAGGGGVCPTGQAIIEIIQQTLAALATVGASPEVDVMQLDPAPVQKRALTYFFSNTSSISNISSISNTSQSSGSSATLLLLASDAVASMFQSTKVHVKNFFLGNQSTQWTLARCVIPL